MSGSALWKQVAEYERQVDAKRKAATKVAKAATEVREGKGNGHSVGNGHGNLTVEVGGPIDQIALMAAMQNAEALISKSFHHWPIVDAALSAFATLLLKDVDMAIALFITGKSSIGKSTIFDMFSETPVSRDPQRDELIRLLAEEQTQDPWIIWRDRFTASSLLSMHSDPRTKKKEVDERALFRRVQHRTLITSELSRIFRGGNEHEQRTLFGMIQQWLDGKGILIDSGTHGELGEKGDFTFVWLGATTPFRIETWKMMADLGPRLLFCWASDAEQKLDDLQFPAAFEECRQAVRRVVNVLQKGKRRSVSWPRVSRDRLSTIKRYAQLAVWGQAFPNIEIPAPNHIRRRMMTILAGRALLHSRTEIDDSDLRLARHIARTSTPNKRGAVLFSIEEGKTTSAQICQATGVARNQVDTLLQELKRVGVLEQTLTGAWKILDKPKSDTDDWIEIGM